MISYVKLTTYAPIRKQKGAAPGQVVVQHEQVILVKPCQNVQ